MANLWPSFDEVINNKGIVAPTKTGTSLWPKFEDVVQPVLNKFGHDVSNHPYNPLNPNFTPPEQTPVPFEQKTIQNFPGTMRTLADIQEKPLSTGNAKHFFRDIWQGLKKPAVEEWNTLKNLVNLNKPMSNPQAVGTGLKAIAGVGNVLLSPITAAFNAANDIPAVGTVSRLVSLPFSFAGELGGHLGDKVVDKLPISDEAKTQVRPGVNEIFSLAGQLALGKVTEVAATRFGTLVDKYGVQDAHTITKKAQELVKEKKVVATPTKDITTYNIEPLDQTQVAKVKQDIEAGNPIEPIIVSRDSSGKLGVLDGAHRLQAYKELGITTIPTIEDIRSSRVAKSIETKAVEKGFTEGFTEVAGYDPITVKEQARLTSDLLKTDLDAAKRMMMGEQPLPSNLREASLLKGLEDYAFAKGDIQLMQDLANSPLASSTSIHAQELRMLAERTPESPVSIMRDLKDRREAAFEKRTGTKPDQAVKKTIQEIKSEVKPLKPDAWTQFIDSIKC